MQTKLITNRDLYLWITTLLARRSGTAATLERYLTNLWAQLSRLDVPPSLTDFATALDAAFDDVAPRYEGDGVCDAAGWQQTIAQQIVDLREMNAAGTLDDDMRYFGIDSPRGARWYNFDPHTYIECGITGAFGGWEPGDDTGRVLVPGPVAVLDAGGKVTSVDPIEIEDPVVLMPSVPWEAVGEFLWCGQYYE